MSAAVRAWLVAALLCAGLPGPGQHAVAADRQRQAAQVVLTNSQPEISLAIAPDVVSGAPPLLALSFPRVVNPSNTGFQIFVYFSYRSAQAASEAPHRILIGNGSLFPADSPGGFVLRASKAFSILAADKATDVRLMLELRPVRAGQPWPPVEVTVAAPQWRQESRN